MLILAAFRKTISYIRTMKLKIGQLISWVLIFGIVNGPLRRFVETLDFGKSILSYFINPMEAAYFFSFIISFGVLSVLVYLVFRETYPRGQKIKTFLGVLLSTIIAVGLRYFFEEKLIYWLSGYKNYKGDYNWSYYFFDNLYYAVIYIAIGIIFFFFQYSKYAEQQKKMLELEKKKSELSFLKSQINPHFLFNSLNNLYYLIYDKSDNALKSVEKLANLLRYSLYESKDEVSLDKELKSLNDFIELEELRHDYDLNLKMNIDENLNYVNIPPFILIPFVENAFKHGELKKMDFPVVVNLNKSGNDLVFEVSNKKKKQQKDEVGGIGLENVRKRLELIYGENYNLEIKDEENTFNVNLKLSNIC